MNLLQEIQAWDQKSAEAIQSTYQSHHADPRFVTLLVEALPDPELSSGASWLMKHWLEQGNVLASKDVARVYRIAEQLQPWSTVLHVLQCAQHWQVPRRNCQQAERFYRAHLDHAKPFVRAWAMDAFFRLAQQYPEYQTEVMTCLDRVLKQEKASVQARARNLKKIGFEAEN